MNLVTTLEESEKLGVLQHFRGTVTHPDYQDSGKFYISYPRSLEEYNEKLAERPVAVLHQFYNNFSPDIPGVRGIMRAALCKSIQYLVNDKDLAEDTFLIAEASGHLAYQPKPETEDEYYQAELSLVNFYIKNLGFKPLFPDTLEADARELDVLIGTSLTNLLEYC